MHHFPGAALVAQLFRQMTKPISKKIVVYGSRHPWFRRYMLLLPGRVYHHLETSLTLLKSPTSLITKQPEEIIPKISDERAVELGSELMIEVVIFALMVLLMVMEWLRSQIKAEAKEMQQQSEFDQLDQMKNNVRDRIEKNQAEIESLKSLKSEITLKLADEQCDEDPVSE